LYFPKFISGFPVIFVQWQKTFRRLRGRLW
jgi:hypothetical protein